MGTGTLSTKARRDVTRPNEDYGAYMASAHGLEQAGSADPLLAVHCLYGGGVKTDWQLECTRDRGDGRVGHIDRSILRDRCVSSS